MGLYGPGGTGNDPAGSSNSSGNATGGGGGYSGGGNDYGGYGGWGSEWGGNAADWNSPNVLGPDDLGGPGMGVGGPQTQINTGTGSENQSTDWSLVAQSFGLGMTLFGPPGAILGGLLGWGLQQDFANAPSAANAASVNTGMAGDGNDGGGRQQQVSTPAVGAQEEQTDQAGATEATETTTTDTGTPSGQAQAAEEEQRRRPGYGYLEAIAGEISPDLSMLWNPNFQLNRSNIGFLS